jgi:hypothetical protein
MPNAGVDEMPIVFERGRANVFNLTGFAFVIAMQIIGGTTMWVNLNRDVADVRETQQEQAALIAPIPDLRFQQTRQAEQIEDLKSALIDTNRRFDRMVEILSGKMDGLTVSVNDLRTDVRVLTQEVRSKGEVVKPTAFKP